MGYITIPKIKDVVNSNITLKAVWIEKSKVTLSFNSDGGSSVSSKKVYVNEKVVWDEDNDSLTEYEALFKPDIIVAEIKFTIVSFHHSYVKITTDK